MFIYIHNTGDPIITPSGEAAAGCIISAKLTDTTTGLETSVWDAVSNELIASTEINTTCDNNGEIPLDEHGVSTFKLWPNDRGSKASHYIIRAPLGEFNTFNAIILSTPATQTFFNLMSQGILIDPATLNIPSIIAGPKGDPGSQGEQGIQGIKGDTGLTGPQGDPGGQGNQGIQGVQGLKGDQGIKGDTGLTGPQGIKGDTGLTGPQGIKGDTGTTGSQGIQGNIGPTGSQGIQGPSGITGGTLTTTLRGQANDTGTDRFYNIHVGPTAPSDTSMLWLDTSV